MSEKSTLALHLFTQGYNCAQAVACAFAPELNLPVETVARLTSGFGGGFGRLREVCGCVSGMTLVAGMLYGYDDAQATTEKANTYAMIQGLANTFSAQHGSLLCKELLGLPNPEGTFVPETRTETYYETRPCPALVESAATLLETLIATNNYPPA